MLKNQWLNEGVDDLIDNMPSLENFKELETSVDLASAKAHVPFAKFYATKAHESFIVTLVTNACSTIKIVHNNVVVPLVAVQVLLQKLFMTMLLFLWLLV